MSRRKSWKSLEKCLGKNHAKNPIQDSFQESLQDFLQNIVQESSQDCPGKSFGLKFIPNQSDLRKRNLRKV